jgi:N-acetylglucosaminyl-diphospho-decaprenol L-rhamnosyltransferase
LFDEEFFFLNEDIDMDLRANVAGHRCLLVPEAIVYHKRGGSFDVTQKIDLDGVRNRLWLVTKNLPLPVLLLWFVVASLRALWLIPARLAGLARPVQKHPEGPVRVPWSGVRFGALVRTVIRGLGRVRAKRREVAHVRRLTSAQLLRRIIQLRTPRELTPMVPAK